MLSLDPPQLMPFALRICWRPTSSFPISSESVLLKSMNSCEWQCALYLVGDLFTSSGPWLWGMAHQDDLWWACSSVAWEGGIGEQGWELLTLPNKDNHYCRHHNIIISSNNVEDLLWFSHFGKQVDRSSEGNHRITIWISNLVWRYLSPKWKPMSACNLVHECSEQHYSR